MSMFCISHFLIPYSYNRKIEVFFSTKIIEYRWTNIKRDKKNHFYIIVFNCYHPFFGKEHHLLIRFSLFHHNNNNKDHIIHSQLLPIQVFY
ncbi:hypothetical protein DERF_016732 [Dermatophagoides farinae]|uniref:Uncharacterized protein n=1 Tax=Dermatophagoides farinae TaxID=6954 RepID=A0A922HMQ2_DERFA|nr:hypothetical protein DERF_016732 [Dermatophagoides farinae]